jgi:hypothetical protein
VPIPERTPVSKAKVAYLIPPDTNANIALVGRLMFEDYRVCVAEKKIKLDGKEYQPGTALVFAKRNPDSLNQRLNELIKETGAYAVAADAGYGGGEGIDLGSEYILAIRKPKIAILASEPTSSTCFGSLRYLFEQVYKFPYTAIQTSRLNRVDLHDYNVLIMPDAWSRGPLGYKAMFGKNGVEKLKNWVSEGGVLICIKGAVDFAIDDEVKLSAAPKYSQRRKTPGDEDDEYTSKAPPATDEKAKEEKGKKEEEKKFEVDRLLDTPGAIVKVKLDDRSFLSWGYGNSIAALVESNNVFVPITDDQGIAAGIYAPENELRIGGFIWEEMLKLLPGKGYVWYEPQGRGQVICFAEEPTFRAGYDGLDRLFFNAVFFSLAYAP